MAEPFTPTELQVRTIYVEATEGHREDNPTEQERRAEFDRWLASEVERARHDMPAELFNEVAELLLSHPHYNGLFALEKLRAQYGRTARRHFGLD